MIPGSNLLNMAFRVIAKETVLYYRDGGRALNAIGQDITIYQPALELSGSFQPVPRKVYYLYGLDLQKSYYTFYASRDILDINRDVSGDQISFKGQRFQCESANDQAAVARNDGAGPLQLAIAKLARTVDVGRVSPAGRPSSTTSLESQSLSNRALFSSVSRSSRHRRRA